MVTTAIILIRVLLGLALGLLGFLLFANGLYTTLNVNFPSWAMAIVALGSVTAGSGLTYGGWRLLSATLRAPEPATA